MRRFVSVRKLVVALLISLSVLLIINGCGGGSGDGQLKQEFPFPEKISNWTRLDSVATYDRETIFDYIDGAGEVYNAYDFAQVQIANYSSEGHPAINVEVFDMGNPDDAYGVFSFAREDERSGIGGGYEQRGNVLCFWQNRYYVCVVAEESNEEIETILVTFARMISEQLPRSSPQPELVELLPPGGLIASSDRFFHLQPTLNYHYYLSRDNILNLNPKTNMVLARYQPGATFLLITHYEDDSLAAEALSSFRREFKLEAGESEIIEKENGKFKSSRQCEQYMVLVLDALTEKTAIDLMNATVDKITTYKK